MIADRARVFLVEDEAAILRFVAKILSHQADVCELVGCASNGQQALEAIGRLRPDIVITDIIMPMMDGLEMMRHASQICPGVRFLVLTGHERFDFAQRAIELKAVNYLLKPIDVEKLTHTVREVSKAVASEHRDLTHRQLREICSSDGRNVAGFALHGRQLRFLCADFGSRCATDEARAVRSASVEDCLRTLIPGAQVYALGDTASRKQDYAVLTSQHVDAEQLACELLDSDLFHTQSRLTLAVSVETESEAKLPETIAHMRHALQNRRRFLSGGVLLAQEDEPSEPAFAMDDALKRLYPGISREQLGAWVDDVVQGWRQRKPTCAAIQSDLERVLSTSLRYGLKHAQYEHPSGLIEALMDCADYEELSVLLFEHIMMAMGIAPESTRQMSSEWLLCLRIRQYLDANLLEDFSREELGARFGYNKNYLSNLFSKSFGVSLVQYVIKKRMDLAKQIIESSPDTRIREIAQRVGYSDPLYFSRVFRLHVGCSPTDYASRIGR